MCNKICHMRDVRFILYSDECPHQPLIKPIVWWWAGDDYSKYKHYGTAGDKYKAVELVVMAIVSTDDACDNYCKYKLALGPSHLVIVSPPLIRGVFDICP